MTNDQTTLGGLRVVMSEAVPEGQAMFIPPLERWPLETRSQWLARVAAGSVLIKGGGGQ